MAPSQIMPMVITPTVINSGGGGAGGTGDGVDGEGEGESDAEASNLTPEEQRALDHARLAQAVYSDDPNHAPPGWRAVQVTRDDGSGYYSVLYQSTEDPSRFVLAHRGTNMESGADWGNNAAQAAGMSDQYHRSTIATDRANEYAREHGGRVPVEQAGHSLGGGMAALNGMRTGAETNTFNSAGVSVPTQARYGVLTAPEDNITNWSAPGDPLTNLNESPAGPGNIMSDAAGNQRSVTPRNDDGSPMTSPNPGDHHSIAGVVNGLEHGGTRRRHRGPI